MADKTISDLTQAESIGGEDLFVLQQNGEAKKLKGEQLMDYVTLNVISVTVETLQLWAEKMLANGVIDPDQYYARKKK